MTSLRDPMFWKLNKKIVDLIDNALKVLPSYAKNELYFPGVEVVNVEVKKMMTSFDYFEFDITDALKIGNGDTTFQVKIGQPRLSHKPFSMKINISSLVIQKGMVKIYLGPKVMPGEFSKNKNLFSLLDCFDINLKRGSNVVTRSSEDMTRFSPDFVSLRALHKKVEDAQFGLDSLPLNSISSQINYPSRMVLPKGTPEGLPLQLLVFVAPYMKTTLTGMYSAGSMEFNEAVMSKLYPLDLPIDDNMILGLPNLLFKDTMVTCKGVSNGGSGTSNGYVRPTQPNAWGGQLGQDVMTPVDSFDMLQMTQNDSPVQKIKYDNKNDDYKTKRPYQQSDYSSYKKFDYKNINKAKTDAPIDVPTEVPIEMPTEMPEDIEIINMPDTEVGDHVYYDMQYTPFEMQNDAPVEGLKRPLQIDYSSKKTINFESKQPIQKFDYSYKKIDYKNINKDKTVKSKEGPTQVPMEEPPSISTVKHVDIEIFKRPDVPASSKYDLKVDGIKSGTEETVRDLDTMEILRVLPVDQDNQEVRVVPMLRFSMPKKEAFTIYDYIIHSFGDDEMAKNDSQEEEISKEAKKKAKSDTKISYYSS